MGAVLEKPLSTMRIQFVSKPVQPWCAAWMLCVRCLAVFMTVLPPLVSAGNFYAGTAPANVPWPSGIVPYEFTNSLTATQQKTYLDGLREWELAGNVKFVPHTNQTHWILFTYNTSGFNNVSASTNPQVVSVASLSRAQVGHEMGHSFGFQHENIRIDQANFLNVLSNNITSGNLPFFQIDPTTVTNGSYDFESVMHLGWDFASTNSGMTATQQPKPPYFVRYQFRMGNLCLSPGDRAALAYLYGPPAVPLTNVVTTTTDVGPGSLRAAMYYVTDHPGTTVRFDIPTSDPGYSNGVFNLHLTGHLPPLATDGMVIDGSTQPGFTSKPLIVVDGSQIIPETFTSNSGLLIYSASNQVKNISFTGFNWNGLTLLHGDATNNTLSGCWIGLDATGTNAAPNALQGILLANGAGGNVIGGTTALARNVLSGNSQYGIFLTNTTGNLILGNYIGTDFSGSNAVPNRSGGVILVNGAHGTVIGGTNTSARNVISGNTNAGIFIGGSGVSGNLVQGNFLGLNASGRTALTSQLYGLEILGGANSNTIGGSVPGAGNVISGNISYGIYLSDPGTSNNFVQGNFIGTDAAGTNSIGNGGFGIGILSGASGNLVGGTGSGARNLISGNPGFSYGVAIINATANSVQGNFIGTDFTGKNPLGNGFAGVGVYAGSTGNLIGGPMAGAGNVIAANGSYNIMLDGAGTGGNLVQGNFIGTDVSGTNSVAYTFANITAQNGATNNFIGGMGAGMGNVIAFAGGSGVVVYDAGTTNNSIRGNSMFSNGALGIDLVGAGDVYPYVTLNDTGDPDLGPNNLQNFPVITNAFGYAASTIVLGKLNSAANRSYSIDVYRNSTASFTGYGEGQFYVGTVNVTTDGAGNAAFAYTNSAGNYAEQYFTATATSASGDTSEFSLALLATNRLAPSASFSGNYSWNTNTFTASLTLQTNFNYRIQTTTNLAASPVVWIDLTNFTATNSLFNFSDKNATNKVRFYRVVSP
jgi:hypothetical protein